MMKKTAILALSTVLASQLMAAEDLGEMFKEGKFGGYVRIHHIFPEASDTIAATGSVIGGKLKYQTGALYGLRFGAALYTVHDTGLTKWDYTTRDGYNQAAGGLLGDDFEGYSTLGEAYASYHLSNTDITYGRQEFKTPMTESEVTIIPNLFEGTVATIKELPNTKITAAHITKIQYGTRSTTEKVLIGDAAYGITAGTGLAQKPSSFTNGIPNAGTGYGKDSFTDIGDATFGLNKTDTAGVTTLAIEYKQGDFKARAWDYYAHELYNTIYGDLEYKMNAGPAKVTLGAQVLSQSDVGDFANSAAGAALKANSNVTNLKNQTIYTTKISADGQIDSLLWGLKANAAIGDWSFNAAYNDSTKGHVIDAWGGNFGYTSTIFSRNENRAETQSYKIGGEYDFSNLGVKGLKFSVNHAEYSTDVINVVSTTALWDGSKEESSETDFMLHYVVPSVKGLWFRLFHVERDNDTRNYDQSHTRLIANLSF